MASPKVKQGRISQGAMAAHAEAGKVNVLDTANVAKRRFGACLYPLAVIAGVAAAPAAQAQLSDTIHPFLQTSISYDDNMLRQTEVPGQTGELGDTSRMVQGGIEFERPIGRQLVSGHATFSRVNFNRYSEFDYDGKDVLADWAWQVGNQFQGHLGSSFVETLTPFVDTNANSRSLRTQRRHYGELNWLLTPSWELHAGFTRFKSEYDLLAQRNNNRRDDTSELGLNYLATSGSKVGVQLRRISVDYDFAPVVGALNNFDQDEVKANVVWQASGKTKLSLLAGWVKRTHRDSALNDESGANGRLIAEYAATGQLNLNGELWREFQALEGGLVGSSLNKGASVGAAWKATAKLSATARLRHEKREFATVNGFVAANGLSDSTTNASMGLNYQPLNRVQLGVDVFRDKRSGNPIVGSRSFRAKGVAVNANVQF